MAALLLEIVVSLAIAGGLSDLTMRDLGVLGLVAALLASGTRQRRVLIRQRAGPSCEPLRRRLVGANVQGAVRAECARQLLLMEPPGGSDI